MVTASSQPVPDLSDQQAREEPMMRLVLIATAAILPFVLGSNHPARALPACAALHQKCLASCENAGFPRKNSCTATCGNALVQSRQSGVFASWTHRTPCAKG
jgi:hypothetical protein